MNEFEKELAQIAELGIKNNPLRLTYEKEVHALRSLPEQLRTEGYSEEQIAREMHNRRRELGRQFKEAAPPLFREYIYAATAAKYGDPLGPTFEMLKEKKTYEQIIESASRPIDDLDNRLTLDGFKMWYGTVPLSHLQTKREHTNNMKKEDLVSKILEYVENDPDNHVSEQDAIYERLAGLKMFELPLVGFASADDELFTTEYKKDDVIHPEYMSPTEWLPGAKTVISFFLPFTEEVKKSNRLKKDEPYAAGIPQRCSAEWLHARIEGQIFVEKLTRYIQTVLEREGYEAIGPSTSEQFRKITPYISNWSERHAAYAAGLGTFGLSKGLITAKGMAGRFGSVITNASFSADVRPYRDPFEYCTMCGACMNKCPVNAIDKTKGCALGKDQQICGSYVRGGFLPPLGKNERVRYGCGKCQIGVPCESGIPKRL